ncbi:MAG: coproporphyrinogen III oxidase family protein [Acidobacteriia bacterium]|nr:coproporphyrinogen III oxidase family protein [Terriglobia bacterium]
MRSVSLGIYISVPFCRTKCSFCNFASGVVARSVFARYVERVSADIESSDRLAAEMGAKFEREVDAIYLGGGTPTVLEAAELERIFAAVRAKFRVRGDAEITVECAPGTLTPPMLESLGRCGVNRVSLGVQSFVDEEAASVGRLHTRAIVLDDLARLRATGITNISIDLIAGLPHQTPESWEFSLAETIASGVPHVSVYMLEVDEDSRLGRELIAGGTRYHAHFVPDDDATADYYLQACERLNAAGIVQYEISNFARNLHAGAAEHPITRSPDLPMYSSRHNLKYWTRQPYLGFGVDAHSMLAADSRQARAAMEREISDYLEHAPNFGGARESEDSNFYARMGVESMRLATPDSLDAYLAGKPHERTPVTYPAALEEAYFLGLRLNRGLQARELAERYGPEAATVFREQIAELRELGLVEICEGATRLTSRGRLLSNEVFQKFLVVRSIGQSIARSLEPRSGG